MEMQADLETWAMVRAQQIIMHHGANLVVSAQRLDHKKTTANTYALRAAIMNSLIEALSSPAVKSGSDIRPAKTDTPAFSG